MQANGELAIRANSLGNDGMHANGIGNGEGEYGIWGIGFGGIGALRGRMVGIWSGEAKAGNGTQNWIRPSFGPAMAAE